MGTPLRVLLIEDNPDDADLVVLALTRGGYEVSSLRVETAVAMSDALDREPWDIVISDYHLPSFDAPAALSVLQAHDLDIPFILVSGTVGEHAAVTSMKAGANDYLNKGNLKRLAPAVSRELHEARNRAEARRAARALERSHQRFRGLRERLAQLEAEGDGALDSSVAALVQNLDSMLAELRSASLEELEKALEQARAHAERVHRVVDELQRLAGDEEE
jgi:DNA-binding NtrC family response regulator